jgi:hypothetical protein
VRPRAFGYMCTRPGLAGPGQRATAEELSDFAGRRGYELAQIYTEHEGPGSPAFALLMDTLRCSGNLVVIVPGMCHFAQVPGLRSAMKEHIESETGARVLVVHSDHAVNR